MFSKDSLPNYSVHLYNCAVVEFSERLAYFSISTNLIIYLTAVLHEGLATSAKNVSYWMGVTCVTPLIGGFIADVYCGRYWMVLVSLIIYLLVRLQDFLNLCITIVLLDYAIRWILIYVV